jgi:acyl-CoA reductase-like NAD-dependent aldehyde dehydrogenase
MAILLNPQSGQLFTARKRLDDRQSHPNLNPAAYGFDTWRQKTFAFHTAVVAQTSTLMRAHRRVCAASASCVGHTHGSRL